MPTSPSRLSSSVSTSIELRDSTEKVTSEELATAKASLIDVFPRQFESAARTVRLFVRDEYEGRPHSYWTGYRDQVRAVTEDDILSMIIMGKNPKRDAA